MVAEEYGFRENQASQHRYDPGSGEAAPLRHEKSVSDVLSCLKFLAGPGGMLLTNQDLQICTPCQRCRAYIRRSSKVFVEVLTKNETVHIDDI